MAAVAAPQLRCRRAYRAMLMVMVPRRARMQRQSLRGGDSASREGKETENRKWSRAEKTGFYGRRKYVALVKSASFPSLNPQPIVVVSKTREGRRAPRLQVHRSQKKGNILERARFHSSFPQVVVYLHFTLLAASSTRKNESLNFVVFYHCAAKSSLVDTTAPFASCLMNMPCNAAMLILRPSFMPSLTISSTCLPCSPTWLEASASPSPCPFA